ncbi:QacE family quaternary ammonium compound efflux SMR transporter [Acetobacter estunensis]|uniref:QacE family quaternary ammonium compound efflux SMR transporter n=1 Tax=Acetobacter estunensis TaxID=104097 RepID=A0A967EEH4_9PROT|nr:SMR family transporter [Acetobacter estunensis]NHO55060.1 QacE family quaternary ammonium compound efflux SMR transporter [Acetobacter estunensis]
MPASFQLLLAIIAEVTATSCLGATQGFTRLLPSVVTVTGYTISFYLLSLAVRTIPTGIAYAIWSGLGTVLVILLAWLLRGQRPDGAAIVGMVLVVAGVCVINLLSGSSPH